MAYRNPFDDDSPRASPPAPAIAALNPFAVLDAPVPIPAPARSASASAGTPTPAPAPAAHTPTPLSVSGPSVAAAAPAFDEFAILTSPRARQPSPRGFEPNFEAFKNAAAAPVTPKPGPPPPFEADFELLQPAPASASQTSQQQPSQQTQAQGHAGPLLSAAPKAAGRTLRRNQLPPELRERKGSIEKKPLQLDSLLQPPGEAPPPPQASPRGAAQVSQAVGGQGEQSGFADFSRAQAPRAPAPAAGGPGLNVASATLCQGLRGPPRAAADAYALGDEFALRLEIGGFARDSTTRACSLRVAYFFLVPGNRRELESEFTVQKVVALGADFVEIGVSAPLMFDDSAVGPCSLHLTVRDLVGNTEVSWKHSFVAKPWGWALFQARLLVEQRPLQVPVVYRYQDLGVSAIVTLEKGMEGAFSAFYDVRDGNNVSLLPEPAACALVPHPQHKTCFALLANVSVARPGNFTAMLAVQHPSRPKQVLRVDLAFVVLDFPK